MIGRVPAPTLIYGYRRHLISLTAVPGGGALAREHAQIAGYNILSWVEDGIAYWAVSDLALPDLNAFAKAASHRQPGAVDRICLAGTPNTADTESGRAIPWLSSSRKRGSITTDSGIWVPACAGTTTR